VIVVGIDPGTASTGWGVVEQIGSRQVALGHGCISTSARSTPAARLRIIHDDCLRVLERFRPDAVAIEELFVNVNVKTALAVGQARGVIMLAASALELSPFEYSPVRIKQAVTGYGRASKLQVQEMTKVILNLDRIPQPDHAADALAVAICCINSNGGALTPKRR